MATEVQENADELAALAFLRGVEERLGQKLGRQRGGRLHLRTQVRLSALLRVGRFKGPWSLEFAGARFIAVGHGRDCSVVLLRGTNDCAGDEILFDLADPSSIDAAAEFIRESVKEKTA